MSATRCPHCGKFKVRYPSRKSAKHAIRSIRDTSDSEGHLSVYTCGLTAYHVGRLGPGVLQGRIGRAELYGRRVG